MILTVIKMYLKTNILKILINQINLEEEIFLIKKNQEEILKIKRLQFFNLKKRDGIMNTSKNN